MFAWFFEFFLWCTADELLISDLWPHELVCTCDTLASRRLPCLVLTCRVAFPRRVLRLCFTSPGVGWTSPRVVNSILGLVVAISLTVPTSRARAYYIRISPLQKIVQTFSGGLPLLIFWWFWWWRTECWCLHRTPLPSFMNRECGCGTTLTVFPLFSHRCGLAVKP